MNISQLMDVIYKSWYFQAFRRAWVSVRDAGVAGSNPVFPTSYTAIHLSHCENLPTISTVSLKLSTF
jgi:hypothetical protein